MAVEAQSTDVGTYTPINYLTGYVNDGYFSANPDLTNNTQVGIGVAVVGIFLLYLLARR